MKVTVKALEGTFFSKAYLTHLYTVAFKNYIDIFFVFWTTYVDIFYFMNVDESQRFWTTYPALLVNKVCECPLTSYVFHGILTSVKDGLKSFLQVLQQTIHPQGICYEAFISSNFQKEKK